jgi:pimeloyl-ACP methyl ester carboxylesterase
MPGQSFAQVGGARIRYQLLGAEHPGATVVLLAGLAGCLEQTELLQFGVSSEVPALAYDRGGYCFSEGSQAHDAEQQAAELAGLLHALKIEKPVVLVGYSASTELARVFLGRYPEKTASLYLIDPWMPELEVLMPKRYSILHYYGRAALQALVQASLGYTHLHQYLENWHHPKSKSDQITDAALAGRHHRWAIVTEWWARPATSRQTMTAPVPPTSRIEVAFTKQQFPDDAVSDAVAKMYAELVARTSRGTLVEYEHVDHAHLMEPSLMIDPMIARIKQLSKEGAP